MASLNLIGLAIDLVGVIGLFFFGLPNQVNKGGAQFIILDQSDEGQSRKYDKYSKLSKISLILIIIGFILQIISNKLIFNLFLE